jgi:hypothetical protein
MIQIASKYGNNLLRLTAAIQPINDIIYNEVNPNRIPSIDYINSYISENCDNLIADIMLKINHPL